MPKVIIDGVEFVKITHGLTPPENKLEATHWAILPDGSVNLYRISDTVLLWLPYSRVWEPPGTVPYTLHCFDDYSEA